VFSEEIAARLQRNTTAYDQHSTLSPTSLFKLIQQTLANYNKHYQLRHLFSKPQITQKPNSDLKIIPKAQTPIASTLILDKLFFFFTLKSSVA
jgi:hypothetical protein